MAVNPVDKLQGLSVNLKPSRFIGRDEGVYADPDRRRILKATHVQGGQNVTIHEMPWAGVIEGIKSVVQIAGGAGVLQNTSDVIVLHGGVPGSVYAIAADGDNFLENAAAGNVSRNFATAVAGSGRLQTCTDGETRPKFGLGDLIAITSTPAGILLGTVDFEVTIGKELPAAGV